MPIRFSPAPFNVIASPTRATPPRGWSVNTGETIDEPSERELFLDTQNLKNNLPLAAKTATDLIKRLMDKFDICVPEAYLRIEEKKTFHFLLFVNQVDYHSPKIYAARMFVNDFTKTEVRFDMRFSFCNLDENAQKSIITASGYNLKHIQSDCSDI